MRSAVAAYPRGFYCEHTPSKTRVHALVRHDAGPDAVTAVLTLSEGETAEEVARILNQALDAVPGPVLSSEIDRVAGLLPTAARASFTEALTRLKSGTWPAPALHGTWPTHNEDDEQAEIPRRLIDEYRRRPSDGRLAQHPGPVVRIGRLLEFHVHDRARVQAAARAAGWVPEADEDLDEDDHLLDAVIWLADEHPEVPGADTLTEASISHTLTIGKDELADHSAAPVVFDFGCGDLCEEPAGNGARGQDTDGRVDYAALFPIPACEHGEEEEPWCGECENFTITPRSAAVLSTALTIMADECRMDVEHHGDEVVDLDEAWIVFDQLPRITWRQDAAWRTQFAQAVTHLRRDLDEGRHPVPRCFGEEMALYLALENAQGIVEMTQDSDDYRATVLGDLPGHARDYDWDEVDESLLGESDITFLFDDAADGIEDPETDVNEHLGIGDMRPAQWFTTFSHLPHREEPPT
jgi:hypothetical protein